MNTERNERARSSYLRVLVSIQKWIGGTAGDASVPLSVSSLPLRPARVHGVGEADDPPFRGVMVAARCWSTHEHPTSHPHDPDPGRLCERAGLRDGEERQED